MVAHCSRQRQRGGSRQRQRGGSRHRDGGAGQPKCLNRLDSEITAQSVGAARRTSSHPAGYGRVVSARLASRTCVVRWCKNRILSDSRPVLLARYETVHSPGLATWCPAALSAGDNVGSRNTERPHTPSDPERYTSHKSRVCGRYDRHDHQKQCPYPKCPTPDQRTPIGWDRCALRRRLVLE
jgi:hypothetical protein